MSDEPRLIFTKEEPDFPHLHRYLLPTLRGYRSRDIPDLLSQIYSCEVGTRCLLPIAWTRLCPLKLAWYCSCRACQDCADASFNVSFVLNACNIQCRTCPQCIAAINYATGTAFQYIPSHQHDGIALNNASFNGLYPDERFSTLIYSAARDTNFPANIGSSSSEADISYSYQLHHMRQHAQSYVTPPTIISGTNLSYPASESDQFELSQLHASELNHRISNLRDDLESNWISAQNKESNAREIFDLLLELPSKPPWENLAPHQGTSSRTTDNGSLPMPGA